MIWAVMWFFLVYNSPADHPRISAEERQFIETALNKKAGGKVVILGVLTHTHTHPFNGPLSWDYPGEPVPER